MIACSEPLHFFAAASMKSFKPLEGPDDPSPPPSGGRKVETGIRGQTRSNATYASTTEPDAKLYRNGAGMEARLAFLGHALRENCCGLIVDACLTQAGSHAGRVAALAMIEPHADRPVAVTLAADKGYDAADFVNKDDERVAARGAEHDAAFGGRQAHHAPSRLRSEQRFPKRIKEAFGWMKTIGGMQRPMLRGTDRVGWAFTFAAAAYNLICLPKLLMETL